jgi:CMP-N-acetylneuraminic acid synthetase
MGDVLTGGIMAAPLPTGEVRLPRMLPMSTLAVIPARAGSKGLPGKHLRLIGGEPMIVHTIRAAIDARRVDRVIVSTNDDGVAYAARRAGAEVPFRRPDELAGDEAPTEPVIQHAVAWAEDDGMEVDVVVTLQPTSPLRNAGQIDAALRLLEEATVRSVVSVAELGMPSAVIGALRNGRFVTAGERDGRRQSSPAAARLTGGIYVTRRDLLAEGRLTEDEPAALVVDGVSAIDVDTAEDLADARRAFRVLRARGGRS